MPAEGAQLAKTYADVQKQVEVLQQEAEKLRRKEVEGVIARIREAIKVHGLTANDLGLTARQGSTRRLSAVPKKAGKRSKSKSGAIKFRDGNGNTWVGRGPRPQWLRSALSAGKQLSDFAV
jgi:DNA-binding protein H-NS